MKPGHQENLKVSHLVLLFSLFVPITRDNIYQGERLFQAETLSYNHWLLCAPYLQGTAAISDTGKTQSDTGAQKRERTPLILLLLSVLLLWSLTKKSQNHLILCLSK